MCKGSNAKALLNTKPVCKACYKLFKTSNHNRWFMKHKWYIRRRQSGQYNGTVMVK